MVARNRDQRLSIRVARARYNRRVAAVAQWIEYWPPKPRVVGSIPASRTNLHDTRRLPVPFPTARPVSLHLFGMPVARRNVCRLPHVG